MPKLLRPVLFGLLAFVAWIGMTYVVMATFLANVNKESADNLGFVLWMILFVGSLLFSGAVAAWFAPSLWPRSSALVGAIGTILLSLISSVRGEIWATALIFFVGVGLSIAGGAGVSYFLKWLKVDFK